jgi:hypothetical protein
MTGLVVVFVMATVETILVSSRSEVGRRVVGVVTMVVVVAINGVTIMVVMNG